MLIMRASTFSIYWAKITFSNDVALNMFPSHTATMFARDCRLVKLNLDVPLATIAAAEYSLVDNVLNNCYTYKYYCYNIAFYKITKKKENSSRQK